MSGKAEWLDDTADFDSLATVAASENRELLYCFVSWVHLKPVITSMDIKPLQL